MFGPWEPAESQIQVPNRTRPMLPMLLEVWFPSSNAKAYHRGTFTIVHEVTIALGIPGGAKHASGPWTRCSHPHAAANRDK